MRIIIACEESQTLCKLFRAAGHEAFSCDLKPCTGGHPEWHLRGDIFHFISYSYQLEYGYWDRLIEHPPCIFLSVTANKWLLDQKPRKSGKLVGEKRRLAQKEAEDFFIALYNSDIDEICLENPVGSINSKLPPTQIIQPYFFLDADKKRTCLWLKGLPKLVHSSQDNLFDSKSHVEPIGTYKKKDGAMAFFTDSISGTSINAAQLRSKTFKGIAEAMVNQWK